jgi:hypothetical protein
VVALVIVCLTLAVTITGGVYLLTGESVDNRLERNRGEAVRKATLIQNAYVRYQSERGEWPASMSETLKPGSDSVPYLEGGQPALFDPWGKQFQVEMRPDTSGKPQPVVWTKDPQGQRVGFPTD